MLFSVGFANAGMLVYDDLSDAPLSSNLYMLVDGGSYVDVDSVPMSYRPRFTRNPDSYIKVNKDSKGKWVLPKIAPKIRKEFEVIVVEDKKVIPKAVNVVKEKRVLRKEVPKEVLTTEDHKKSVLRFRVEMSVYLNKILQIAKAGRAEGIIEGSLEKVRYYSQVGKRVQRNGDFSGLEMPDKKLLKSISRYEEGLKREKQKLDDELEKIKVKLVQSDLIPLAEEVDKVIKKSGQEILFPSYKPSVKPVYKGGRVFSSVPRNPEYYTRRIRVMKERLHQYREDSPIYIRTQLQIQRAEAELIKMGK